MNSEGRINKYYLIVFFIVIASFLVVAGWLFAIAWRMDITSFDDVKIFGLFLLAISIICTISCFYVSNTINRI